MKVSSSAPEPLSKSNTSRTADNDRKDQRETFKSSFYKRSTYGQETAENDDNDNNQCADEYSTDESNNFVDNNFSIFNDLIASVERNSSSSSQIYDGDEQDQDEYDCGSLVIASSGYANSSNYYFNDAKNFNFKYVSH